jgi:hypothetical protein
MTTAKERAREKLAERLFDAVVRRLDDGDKRRLRADPKKLVALRLRAERAVTDAGDHAEVALDLACRVSFAPEEDWSDGLFKAFAVTAAELRRQHAPAVPALNQLGGDDDMF